MNASFNDPKLEQFLQQIAEEKSAARLAVAAMAVAEGEAMLATRLGGASSYSRNTMSSWPKVVGILATVALLIVGMPYLSDKTRASGIKTYATSAAQRANVTLADGSAVTLGPATTLRVSGREIELDGEALFTVSHKSDAVFVVKTGNTTTRVLGTMFSVRKYGDDLTARVAVAEGKVAVNNTILTNGDIAISGKNVNVQHDAERVLSLLAFAQGKLSIDDESLAQSAAHLGRWLNLEIRFDSAAGARRLSTVLQYETPSQALEDIARLTRTKYARAGRVVTFTAN